MDRALLTDSLPCAYISFIILLPEEHKNYVYMEMGKHEFRSLKQFLD